MDYGYLSKPLNRIWASHRRWPKGIECEKVGILPVIALLFSFEKERDDE